MFWVMRKPSRFALRYSPWERPGGSCGRLLAQGQAERRQPGRLLGFGAEGGAVVVVEHALERGGLDRRREVLAQVGDQRTATFVGRDEQALQGHLAELMIEVVERALQLERDPLEQLLAGFRGCAVGQRLRADVDVAQRVELAVAAEGEQAATIVEGDERQAAIGLFEQRGKIALSGLGHVDGLERDARALERLDARAHPLAPRRDGENERGPTGSGAVARN